MWNSRQSWVGRKLERPGQGFEQEVKDLYLIDSIACSV